MLKKIGNKKNLKFKTKKLQKYVIFDLSQMKNKEFSMSSLRMKYGSGIITKNFVEKSFFVGELELIESMVGLTLIRDGFYV